MADLLASPLDLPLWLGFPSGTQPDDRTVLALEVATGWVQGFTNQKLVAVTNDTVTIDNRRPVQRLYLPERPVTSVTSVTVNGIAYSAATDWTLVGNTLLTGFFADYYAYAWKGRWIYWPEFVTVTYSHGYATAPQDIRGVILSAAARIIGNPEGHSGWTEERIGFTGAPNGGGLSPTEMSTLSSYQDLVVAG